MLVKKSLNLFAITRLSVTISNAFLKYSVLVAWVGFKTVVQY